ncbi:MAG TPA: UDP-N-acetylglucosamine 2-epimerase (non-hydrolyzing) [Gemmatimonadaceae bacterium]|nr:UDP-N-acetylglucosamine 2-epimerase (non-hydrolyzing) [Gemmatimonadaceae bacterium]
MKALVVAGARPNFMKVAPILEQLQCAGAERVFVHTGQHYDVSMSEAFFRDLELPAPDFYLGVGSGSHAKQTARVMEAFEPVLVESKPDWVVLVGDVNSTLACALVAAKLRQSLGCRVAHVEAGLRSNDWNMPEEVNRVLTDRVSDLLLTPSHDAVPNLLREGIAPERMVFVGNVMIDSLMKQLPAARALNMAARVGVEGKPFVLATLHRPSNVDDRRQLGEILEGLAAISREATVVLPLHPRTRDRIKEFGFESLSESLSILEPLGYREMLGLLDAAAVTITDSGGVQEESTVLGVPCATLRETTERPVTITEGTNRLAEWPLTSERIVSAYRAAMADGRKQVGERVPDGWDGRAAERVVRALMSQPAYDPAAS